jgi:cell division protein FtsB
MDNNTTRNDESAKLRRREEELLARIEKLKTSMSQTSEIDTLVFKNGLMKQAQEELRRVQEKLTGVARD